VGEKDKMVLGIGIGVEVIHVVLSKGERNAVLVLENSTARKIQLCANITIADRLVSGITSVGIRSTSSMRFLPLKYVNSPVAQGYI
jgi:hypothetical protein